MKFTCTAEKLKEAFGVADRATGKNLALPILGNILIKVTDKTIKILATNLSLGIECVISAVVESEGVTALRGDIIVQYLSVLKQNEEVSCELIGDLFVCKTKKSKISIKTFPYEDFPTIPIVNGTKITIPSKTLVVGVNAVVYSTAPTDIKPEISGVCIYTDQEALVFVATDSFRLAEKKIKVKQIPSISSQLIIPAKNIIEVVKMLDGVDDMVSVEYTQNQISFTYRNMYMTSRLINGNFPDYKQIIPKEKTTEAIVLKQDLILNLKMANVFSGKLNQVIFDIKPKEKSFVIHTTSSDIGDETSSLDAVFSGLELSLSVNLRYFIDCFQSISSDSISITASGPQKPVIVRGSDDSSFTYLVMPMNR